MKYYVKMILLATMLIIFSSCEKEEKKVTIDFNCNNIKEYKCDIVDKKLDCVITLPECKGYSFAGWYDAASNGKEINLDSDFKEGTVVYAGWEADGSPTKVVQSGETVETTEAVNKYKIAFNINGGTGEVPPITEVTYEEMLPQIEEELPTREGYTFMGWYGNADYKKGVMYYNERNEPTKYFTQRKNIRLYAGWKLNKEESKPTIESKKNYNVTLELNGGEGSTPSNVSVRYDELMPAINGNMPTRKGYTFTGWYDNPDYTKGKIYYNEYNTAINHYDVKKDITLYAGWSKNRVIMSYKIMFDATTNGGTGGQINPVMVKTGERLPEITSVAPERTGFTFVGWYDSVNNGKVYYDRNGKARTTFNETKNVILYAQYKANRYNITFNANEGTGEVPTVAYAAYGYRVPKIDNVVPSRSGYTFLGWYDNPDYTKGISYYGAKNERAIKFEKTSDVVLYAGWSKILEEKYTVTFNANEGLGGQTESISVKKGASMPSINTKSPKKLGYKFNGWYDSPSGGKKYYDSSCKSVSKYDKSSGTTLYAQYSPITYKINYKLNGGTASNVSSATYDKVIKINNPTKDFKITIDKNNTGATISSTSASAKQGFLGWTASSNLDTANALYGDTDDPEYRWTSSNTKVSDIYFENLLSTSGTITLTANWKQVDITLPTVTKNGYECGYSTTSSGGVSYKSGAKYTPSLTSSSATLYVTCTTDGYIVAFNANGGSGGQSEQVMAIYGEDMPGINQTKPTRTYYEFTGWYDSPSGGTMYYTADLKSARKYNLYKGIILYAHWVEKFTINYNCNDGNGYIPSQTIKAGEKFTLSENKCTKEGYTPVKWVDTSGQNWDDLWTGTWNFKDGQYGINNHTLTLMPVWKSKGNLKIYYLSLGRYDGYLIMGNDTTIFIDGGDPSPGYKSVEFLKKMGITKLDAIIGSHLHDNHVYAHTIILDNFKVSAAYYPDDPRTCKSNKTCSDGVTKEKINKLSNKLKENNVPINVLTPNMNVMIGNLTFDILGPLTLGSSVNSNSLHMILKYGDKKFYFSGDSGTGVFKSIYNKYDHSLFENIDIFKHPHHGQNEVPSDFISVMKPKYVIVPNTSKKLASSEYNKVGSVIYALGNKEGGYVLAETDGKTLKVTDNRKPK